MTLRKPVRENISICSGQEGEGAPATQVSLNPALVSLTSCHAKFSPASDRDRARAARTSGFCSTLSRLAPSSPKPASLPKLLLLRLFTDRAHSTSVAEFSFDSLSESHLRRLIINAPVRFQIEFFILLPEFITSRKYCLSSMMFNIIPRLHLTALLSVRFSFTNLFSVCFRVMRETQQASYLSPLWHFSELFNFYPELHSATVQEIHTSNYSMTTP